MGMAKFISNVLLGRQFKVPMNKITEDIFRINYRIKQMSFILQNSEFIDIKLYSIKDNKL